MTAKICDVCRVEFYPEFAQKRVCGEKCRKERARVRTAARPDRQIKWAEMYCQECGAWFSAKYVKGGRKYCSVACSDIYTSKSRKHRPNYKATYDKQNAVRNERVKEQRAVARALKRNGVEIHRHAQKLAAGKKRRNRIKKQACGCAPLWKLPKLENTLCAYCDRIGTEWDHVISIARGGAHCWKNMVWACTRCNRQRRAVSVEKMNMSVLRIQTTYVCEEK